MQYQQKDLGYPRTKSNSVLRVTFSNGEVFDVPAQVIADDRDENYKDEREDTIGFIQKRHLDRYELTDWASNNMNWSDLKDYAVAVPSGPTRFDYEEEWPNAEKQVKP